MLFHYCSLLPHNNLGQKNAYSVCKKYFFTLTFKVSFLFIYGRIIKTNSFLYTYASDSFHQTVPFAYLFLYFETCGVAVCWQTETACSTSRSKPLNNIRRADWSKKSAPRNCWWNKKCSSLPPYWWASIAMLTPIQSPKR